MEGHHPRSEVTSSRSIVLHKTDSLERLKEFCKQGKYSYKINWDRFQNGFMCECVLSYSLHRKSTKILKKEVCWVETNDLIEAQKTVATIILNNIGLGSPGNHQDVGTEKSWADIADED